MGFMLVLFISVTAQMLKTWLQCDEYTTLILPGHCALQIKDKGEYTPAEADGIQVISQTVS